MKLKMVLLAALVAVSVSLPGAASARIVSVVWTCNSDGYEHVVATNENGVSHEFINGKCGAIAFGGGFNLLLSEVTRVSEGGQAFLGGLEAREGISFTRVRNGDAGTIGDTRGMETIHLRSDEVGPWLAEFFSRIDRDWDGQLETASTSGTIFDRWGQYRTALVLVPGDKGITILLTAGEDAPKMDTKQSCLDQSGFWRQGTAREWGCWTTRR